MSKKVPMKQSWTQDVFIKAWDFATLAHHGQTYGGPNEGQRIDYINHVGAVTMEVIWALQFVNDCDGDLAIQCALLHDVVEDTEYTIESVAQRFGNSVADGVAALTKDKTLATKQEQMADSLRRIREQPVEVWMVKLADRITNLSEPPFYWSDEKKSAYREEAVTIHRALHEANASLASRLSGKIEVYGQYIK
ncbi:MAG: HD domain-containing protein [Chloroflexota bacterium]